MNVATLIRNLRDRIVALEVLTGNTASDPQRLANERLTTVKTSVTGVSIGRISEFCPALLAYRVEVSGYGTVVCTPLSQAGGQLRVCPGYSVDDMVLIATQRGTGVGVIIGRIPPVTQYGNFEARSFISLSDNFSPDPFYKSYLETIGEDEQYSIPSWTPNAVFNNTDAGEFFIGSPAGSKFFIDPFMCYLATNDATGVWAFRDDSLLRVSGLNYQKITSGSYEESINDNGEYGEIHGHCLYPWEALGYFKKPQSDIITEKSDWEKGDARVFYREPQEIDAKPFYRVLGLGGWIGQGTSTSIVAPSSDHTVSKYGQKEENQQALSRIAQNVNGLITIESAKGVSIVKRSYLPAPQRLVDPSDASKGDTKDEYDFEHSDVTIKGEPEYQVSSTNKGMQSAMAVDDYRTYITNYKPFAGILEHKKDWFIPEEKTLGSSDTKNTITNGSSKDLLEPPEPYKVSVDGKEEQEYYPVEAGLHFLPDGGVVLHDGYGSELRMSCGQITISAPLGVWIRSGKDVRIWSGKDTTVRSKDAIEMSSTSGSVRVKAEKHLEMIGGNDGQNSGVIIESRGRGEMDFSQGGDGAKMNGILLKATDGVISSIGNTIYTKARGDGMQGSIMLDANNGEGNLYTSSNVHIDYVQQQHAIAFGDFKNRRIRSVQQSTEDEFTIPGQVLCGGDALFAGGIVVDGAIQGGDHISTKGGADNPFVGGISGEGKTRFDNNIKTAKKRLEKDVPKQYKDSNNGSIAKSIDTLFYDQKRPGNKDVLDQCGFSFRTDEELNLDGFYVYADRWQTICDVSSSTWQETKIETKTGGHYPFPGDKYFTSTDCYVTQPLSLYENGAPKARMDGENIASEYKEPKYEEPEVKSLNKYPLL